MVKKQLANSIAKLFAGMVLCVIPALTTANNNNVKFPDPLNLVIGYNPGGAFDSYARDLANQLSPLLNTTVVVKNKPGAANVSAYLEFKRHQDNSIFLGATPMIYSNWGTDLQKQIYNYDDMTFLMGLVQAPLLIVSTKFKSIEGLISQKNSATVATAGVNSPHHELLNDLSKHFGKDVIHIPMKGDNESIREVMSGRVDYAILGPITVERFKKDLNILAVHWYNRLDQFDTVKTLREYGIYPRYVSGNGIIVSNDMPVSQKNKLATALTTVFTDHAFVNRIYRYGFIPRLENTDKFNQRIKSYLK